MKNHFYLSLLLAVCVIGKLHAQQPAFDHIVVVIEENHSFSQIIGSSAAPNINALAASGANIVNASTDPQGNASGSHAVRHPSQPNYLELYSGSNQGTIQDGHPGTTSEPFSSPPSVYDAEPRRCATQCRIQFCHLLANYALNRFRRRQFRRIHAQA